MNKLFIVHKCGDCGYYNSLKEYCLYSEKFTYSDNTPNWCELKDYKEEE